MPSTFVVGVFLGPFWMEFWLLRRPGSNWHQSLNQGQRLPLDQVWFLHVLVMGHQGAASLFRMSFDKSSWSISLKTSWQPSLVCETSCGTHVGAFLY
jgi:hypothetical protein